MFITRKHLSRRTFLRGAGVAIGLPFLDAMVPAGTALAQTAAKPIPHMGFIYFPHGAIMDQWTPAKDGTDFELPSILKPFAPFKKQLTVISALDNKPASGFANDEYAANCSVGTRGVGRRVTVRTAATAV